MFRAAAGSNIRSTEDGSYLVDQLEVEICFVGSGKPRSVLGAAVQVACPDPVYRQGGKIVEEIFGECWKRFLVLRCK